jgi:hypothetical protein
VEEPKAKKTTSRLVNLLANPEVIAEPQNIRIARMTALRAAELYQEILERDGPNWERVMVQIQMELLNDYGPYLRTLTRQVGLDWRQMFLYIQQTEKWWETFGAIGRPSLEAILLMCLWVSIALPTKIRKAVQERCIKRLLILYPEVYAQCSA